MAVGFSSGIAEDSDYVHDDLIELGKINAIYNLNNELQEVKSEVDTRARGNSSRIAENAVSVIHIL